MDRNCVLVSLFHGSERAATAGWTKRAAATRRRGNRRINTFTLIVLPITWPMVFCFALCHVKSLWSFFMGKPCNPPVVQRIGCIGDEFAEEDPGLPTHAPTTSKGILKATKATSGGRPAAVATLAPGPPRLATAP